MQNDLHNLIGPAAAVLAAARALAAKSNPLRLLLDGDPGIGKTTCADQLALELTGSRHAIEHVNGQSLSVELVRAWKQNCAYGNLFSARTVKRIDEIDLMSSSAIAELLTHLDYLPVTHAIIATTNEFAKLRAQTKGRLESRFVRFHVDAPSVESTARFLLSKYRISIKAARAIAAGAVPDGCLPTVGCNVRTAINDAIGLTAARKARAA